MSLHPRRDDLDDLSRINRDDRNHDNQAFDDRNNNGLNHDETSSASPYGSHLAPQQYKLLTDPPVMSSVTMINIPYRWLVFPQVGSIAFAMFGSLIWALLYDFDQVVVTHCTKVKQFFPSFSAVIGNGFPEMFIWRLGLMVLIPLRMIQGLIFHWSFSYKQLYYQPGGQEGRHSRSTSTSQQQSYELANLAEDPGDFASSSSLSHYNPSRTDPNNQPNKPKPQRYHNFNPVSKPLRHSPRVNSQLPPDPSFIGPSNPNQRAISIGHQHVSTTRYLTGLMHSITLWIEYSGLAMLTYVSSTEHFPSHAGGFIIFIIASQIHTILNLILTRRNLTLKGAIYKVQLVKLTLWFLNLLSIYSCYHFYTLHNQSCQDYIYSFFGLSEYSLVTTNICLHVLNLLEHSWQGTFSFSLVIPSFALNCHPDNYDIINRSENEDDTDWLHYGQVDVPVIGDLHHTEDELDHFDLIALSSQGEYSDNSQYNSTFRQCLEDNMYGGVEDEVIIDPVGPGGVKKHHHHNSANNQHQSHHQKHTHYPEQPPSSSYISSIRQNPIETDSDLDLDDGFEGAFDNNV